MRVIRRRTRRNPTLIDAVRRYTQLLFLIVALLVGLASAGHGDVFGGRRWSSPRRRSRSASRARRSSATSSAGCSSS
jgi:hypothetical protein